MAKKQNVLKLKICLFPAPDRPLKNLATRNIFLQQLFFFGYRKFRHCSRMYVRNWFTLLNEQNPLLDFEGTRFVNDLWKITKKPYLPTHRWNGGLGAGSKHIFKGGLGVSVSRSSLLVTQFIHCDWFIPWKNSIKKDILQHNYKGGVAINGNLHEPKYSVLTFILVLAKGKQCPLSSVVGFLHFHLKTKRPI